MFPRRVRNFIDALVEASQLIDKGKGIYQQTLLGALEVEQSGLNHLRHLIPEEMAQPLPESQTESTAELPEATDVSH